MYKVVAAVEDGMNLLYTQHTGIKLLLLLMLMLAEWTQEVDSTTETHAKGERQATQYGMTQARG